MEKEKLLTIGN